MQIAFLRADEFQLAIKEQIELSGERTFRAARTFGDGFEQTEFVAAPVDDERGLGQRDAAQKDGAGFVQHVANEAAPGELASIVFS